ncbi:MAG: sugar phosphate isomerase/epimerase [Planctomycetes bacterium]|nr:sugar phosphate isomerase/epimerase [Planctomycetota bacterium]
MKKVVSGFLFEKDYTHQNISIEDFFALASNFGYDGVDLRETQISPDSDEKQIEKIISLSQKYRLSVEMVTFRGYRYATDEGRDKFNTYLKLMKKIGCPLIKVGAEIPELNREMAQRAKDGGVVTATNNHSFCITETVKGTLDFIKKVNHENYGVLYDPSHLYIMDNEMGNEYKRQIEALFPYIKAVICQNVYRVKTNTPGAIKGKNGSFLFSNDFKKGDIDWEEIIPIIQEKKYSSSIILFYHEIGKEKAIKLMREFLEWFK